MKKIFLVIIISFIFISQVEAASTDVKYHMLYAGDKLVIRNTSSISYGPSQPNIGIYMRRTSGSFRDYYYRLSDNYILSNQTISTGQTLYIGAGTQRDWTINASSTWRAEIYENIRLDPNVLITLNGVVLYGSAPPVPPEITEKELAFESESEVEEIVEWGDGVYARIKITNPDPTYSYYVFRDGEQVGIIEPSTNAFNWWQDSEKIHGTDMLETYKPVYTVKSFLNGEFSEPSNEMEFSSAGVPLLMGNTSWSARLGTSISESIFNKEFLTKGVSTLLVASGFVFDTFDQMSDTALDFLASVGVSTWGLIDKMFEDTSSKSVSVPTDVRTEVEKFKKTVTYSNTGGTSVAIPQNPGRVITPGEIATPKPISVPLDIPVPNSGADVIGKDITVDNSIPTSETTTAAPTYPAENPYMPDTATSDGSIFQALRDILAKLIQLISYILSGQWLTAIINAITGLFAEVFGFFSGIAYLLGQILLLLVQVLAVIAAIFSLVMSATSFLFTVFAGNLPEDVDSIGLMQLYDGSTYDPNTIFLDTMNFMNTELAKIPAMNALPIALTFFVWLGVATSIVKTLSKSD